MNKLITIPPIVGSFILGVISILPLCVLTDTGDSTEPDEETKFIQKLEYLRTQAEVFLKMLNDMRRRLKELSPESPAAQQYRCVFFLFLCSLYLITLLINSTTNSDNQNKSTLQERNERCYPASLPFE